MIVRCGDCRHPIELSDDAQFRELNCPNCTSSIDLVGADTTVSYTPSATETIGHFTLCEQLGAGAFGIVWKARDTSLDRTVAIKIPRRGRLTPAETEQFFREARAAAQLRHPNIVSLHEVGRDGETIYIVSDFIDGVTLTDHLAIRRPDFREAAELCCKLADALQHAHGKGVIHRDLKPGNVMLDRYDEPYVMDFGLAKREAGEITMTMDGQILGTPAYMSPEQARGESHGVDRRADIFSMGVILFELLTGERPFRGSARMLLHQLLTEDAPSPRSLNANVPRDLETICLKCLRREPDRRYATARELGDDLSSWLDGRPISARPVRRPERVWLWFRRHPTITVAISLTLLAIVFSGWFSMRVRHGARIREMSTVVSSLNSTRGIILPPLERLNEFPRQATLSELQNQLQQAEGTRATALMCALAYLGDRRIDSLVSLVRISGAYEFDNLLDAMAGARGVSAHWWCQVARASVFQKLCQSWLRSWPRRAVMAMAP